MSDYLSTTQSGTLEDRIHRLEVLLESMQKRTIDVNSLDDISNDLGVQMSGEFRSGNDVEPGDGFSGLRMGYPGFDYGGVIYNLVGILEDTLQFGLRVEDGAGLFAGGRGVIDQSGINLNGLLYALRHYATDPDGANARYGRLEMFYPEGKTIPALSLGFFDGAEPSELMSNGGFETGDLSGWTGVSWSASSENIRDGSYGAVGQGTLLSNRVTISGGASYHFRAAAYKSPAYPVEVTQYVSLNIYARWYDASSGGNLLRTDLIGRNTVDRWQQHDLYLKAPDTALSVEVYLDAGASYGNIDSVSIQLATISKRLYFGSELLYKDELGTRRVLSANRKLARPPAPRMAKGSNKTALSAGNYYYKLIFIDAEGETIGSDASQVLAITNVNASGPITVTIPLGPQGTSGRKLYRTVANGSVFKLLTTVNNNTTTTYSDDTADASLGTATPPLENTTSVLPAMPIKAFVRWGIDARSNLKSGIATSGWNYTNTTQCGPFGLYPFGHGSDMAELYDWFEFEVYLAPGTYTMLIHYYRTPTGGTINFYEDDASIPFASNVDLYSSSSGAAEKIVTGCVLSGIGLHHIRAVVVGKNASASDYNVIIADIEFVRE